ncbi:MAG: cation:proton antiporter [Bdellovibrionales bacterium]
MTSSHLPVFIHDLAVILVTAGATSLLFRWMKQPVVLGYLVSGILVGPHLTFLPTVSDVENVKLWGEIGVIFVLFSLGLEFSFRRLLKIGGLAGVTAAVETSFVMLFGVLVASLLGWSRTDSLFWGGMLCISSTSIILKVFEENGLKSRQFAHLVTAVLIVEDLVAVLLMVLLSTLALAKEFDGFELLTSAARLGFFLVLWFVVGLFLIPNLMRHTRRLLSDESALIFSVGLCLAMVLIATGSGFSPALGAFVMGSLLAESSEGHRIEKVLAPLRTFFGAVFFVSVGMLFDPSAFASNWEIILLMSVLLIISKTVFVSLGALSAGEKFPVAVTSGLSLTQIGEFSFIIAGLGMGLGVISQKLYALAVGVSIVTSFTSPLLIRSAPQIVGWIEARLPRRWMELLTYYQAALNRQTGTRFATTLIRAYAPLMTINLVLLIAVTWTLRQVFFPRLLQMFGWSSWVVLGGLAVNILCVLPFLYGLCWRGLSPVWAEKLSHFPRMKWFDKVIISVRSLAGVFVFLVIAAQYMSWRMVSGISLVGMALLGFVFYRYAGHLYRQLEVQFLDQLGSSAAATQRPKELLPWEGHLVELSVSPNSPLCGLSLEAIGPQEAFGVMIAAIDRGRKRILAPKGTDFVFPMDRLQVVGADESVERLRRLAEMYEDGEEGEEHGLELQSVVLAPDSPLCGQTLRESNLRLMVDGLVVGVERDGARQLQPPPDLQMRAGDRLWIVGDPEKIENLNRGEST